MLIMAAILDLHNFFFIKPIRNVVDEKMLSGIAVSFDIDAQVAFGNHVGNGSHLGIQEKKIS